MTQDTRTRIKKKITPLTLDGLQKKSLETALYPKLYGKQYAVLGLASEAGEVSGARAKSLLDGKNRDDLIKEELGDVLWYCSIVAEEYGWNLSDVAELMLDKLQERKKHGTIEAKNR